MDPSSSSSDSGGNAQWALPMEVLTAVADEVLRRHRRDFGERRISPNATHILPLLLTTKSLKDHLLPKLYHTITLHTHAQLLSFLRNIPPPSFDLIQHINLEVARPRNPEAGQGRLRAEKMRSAFRRGNDSVTARTLEAEAAERERAREKAEVKVVREAGEALRGRVEMYRAHRPTETDAAKEDKRLLRVGATSTASLYIATSVKFPILELVHPPRFPPEEPVYPSTSPALLPSVRTILIHANITNLTHLLTQTGLPSLDPRSDLREIVIFLQPLQDGPHTLRAMRQSLLLRRDVLEELVGGELGIEVVVKMQKTEGQTGHKGYHLFCVEPEEGEAKLKMKGVKFEGCLEGRCPFRDSTERTSG